MLKKILGNTPHHPLLIPAQGTHWSRQRLLGISSQLGMLLLAAVLLTNIVLTIGEQRLQQEWATQRYGELQTLGTLLTDKVTFAKFRTRTFARGELLRQYLARPNAATQQLVQDHWHNLEQNMTDLIGIALYNPEGKLVFATSDIFGTSRLPASLLGNNRTMGQGEIYTSPIEFITINGKLEPYMYQLAWLDNSHQGINGYLVTYNSISRSIASITPAFTGINNPLIVLGSQGLLYEGNVSDTLLHLPDSHGESIGQTHPTLWQKMSQSHFGQYHDEHATYVYLKVELATQYETKREYYLLSYIANQDISARFTHWRQILITGALLITLLAGIAIVLSHLYRLEQRSRQLSIELSQGLFNTDAGWMITGDTGRIIRANQAAAQALHLSENDLEDRSLQWALQLEHRRYSDIASLLDATGYWQGEIELSQQDGTIRIRIRKLLLPDQRSHYLLINIDNITELTQTRNEANLYRLLAETDQAIALTTADSRIIKFNRQFQQLLQLEAISGTPLADLLDNSHGQWQRICEQLNSQGHWQGQVNLSHLGQDSHGLQANMTTTFTPEGELEYVCCRLCQASPRALINHTGEQPHRSTVLLDLTNLEHYFNALSVAQRNRACLLLLDISPAGMLSHLSDIDKLEQQQQQVEIQLLRELPRHVQLSRWQIGKLIAVMPDTAAAKAHDYAREILDRLTDKGLAEGVCIGIAANRPQQSLEQLLRHAEVALRRARQSKEQNICQAYTRPDMHAG
ncbi:diguanylate cyclase [Shewanella sp. NFH-SH190041]|uniref:PAS domain-containing protein n=1 Tax=Shewanella sp. NFH-SH190041 TaxID=2950245 RepID=UPI0021C452D5|nr:PAS domain-containing protein [Shewanella sp. NFH-SH190041]BDM63519.1 diguanylate cyclase [Shewanella sp. NFH-SH190041]